MNILYVYTHMFLWRRGCASLARARGACAEDVTPRFCGALAAQASGCQKWIGWEVGTQLPSFSQLSYDNHSWHFTWVLFSALTLLLVDEASRYFKKPLLSSAQHTHVTHALSLLGPVNRLMTFLYFVIKKIKIGLRPVLFDSYCVERICKSFT